MGHKSKRNPSSSKRKRRKTRKAKRRDRMFTIEQHNKLIDFQKLGYIADEIAVTYRDIAAIIDENPSPIHDTVKGGLVPTYLSNAQEVTEKLYQLRMIFSSLLRMSGYSINGAKDLLYSSKPFSQYTDKPPWFPDNLKNYLMTGKMAAVVKALVWLRKY